MVEYMAVVGLECFLFVNNVLWNSTGWDLCLINYSMPQPDVFLTLYSKRLTYYVCDWLSISGTPTLRQVRSYNSRYSQNCSESFRPNEQCVHFW